MRRTELGRHTRGKGQGTNPRSSAPDIQRQGRGGRGNKVDKRHSAAFTHVCSYSLVLAAFLTVHAHFHLFLPAQPYILLHVRLWTFIAQKCVALRLQCLASSFAILVKQMCTGGQHVNSSPDFNVAG